MKNTYTRRVDSEEYFVLVDEVMDKLLDIYAIDRVDVIPAYFTKSSFGDMDILYSTCYGKELSVDTIKHHFSPNEITKNGELISFDYKEFQVDLIYADQDIYKYSLNYFSWNDFGNLGGKLARYYGLSHGHKGLFLPLRDETGNLYASIPITTDHSETLKFVGLDPDRFEVGFNTLKGIFDYVSSSPVYSPEWYKLENISSIGRIRDKKRTTYQEFLKYNETKTGNFPTKVIDKTVFYDKIFEIFPKARKLYEEAIQKHTFSKYVSQKFNGNLVREMTGLQNKELGMFMKHLRTLPKFEQYILCVTSDSVIQFNINKEFLKYNDTIQGLSK